MPENIILRDLDVPIPALPSGIVSQGIATSISLNFSLGGGSFSISVLRDSIALPPKNSIITLPFGRLGFVQSIVKGFSTGGLLDVISGPMIPLVANQQSFVSGITQVGDPPKTLRNLAFQILQRGTGATAIIGGTAQFPVLSWLARDFPVQQFSFRGIVLQGIQSLAGNILADVILNRNRIIVAEPGRIVGETFIVPKSDIVSVQQSEDFTLDRKAVLNPVLDQAEGALIERFIFDDEHAQKQPVQQVAAGAPGSEGSTDFVPIPDGFMVDGNFEEWTPPSATDFTNPSPTPPGGRYWKVFPSPTSPGQMRGIISFNRLVKELNLPENVATFVGSPVSVQTQSGAARTLLFGSPRSESGISGFEAGALSFFDAVSGQFVSVKNALVLVPVLGNSAFAQSNFFSIQLEIWTFPKVLPTTFPAGDPENPFNIPNDAVIVSPPNVVVHSREYFDYYMLQYERINSPRLRTTVTAVFRDALPEPGDELIVQGLPIENVGRITSVTLGYSRGGVTLGITAEVFNFGKQDPQGYSGVVS